MSDQWGISGPGTDPAGATTSTFSTDSPTGVAHTAPNQIVFSYSKPPAPEQSAGMAVTTLVLAVILWPLGLFLSLRTLIRIRKRGGDAGRKLTVASIVLSLIAGAGSIVLLAKQVEASPAMDPGCAAAQSSLRALAPKLSAAESQLSSDLESRSLGSLVADLSGMSTALQSAEGDLDHAESVTTHQSVKTQIVTVNGDLSTLGTTYQAVAAGNLGEGTAISQYSQQLDTDDSALDSVCNTY